MKQKVSLWSQQFLFPQFQLLKQVCSFEHFVLIVPFLLLSLDLFSFSFIFSALTTREVVQITREMKFSETLVPVVASVVSGIFILAALTVLIVFYKRYTQRCGGQLQGSAAGEFSPRARSDFVLNINSTV